jgi:ribosomal protein S18 acetylase RimI-like enzyme
LSLSSSISRFAAYFRRHGVAATFRRAQLSVKRTLFAGRMVVYYCDLNEQSLRPANFSKGFRVARVTSLAELSVERLQEITSFWNSKLASQNLRERFERGASLWLVECEDHLAGYGWSLQGGTIEQYYFPLTPNDVHLFDFHVFPHYRGRGINPYLVGRVLEGVAANFAGRAFIEAAEWNDAQLSSLRKTPFRCLGTVRSISIRGHKFTSWLSSDTVAKMQKRTEAPDPALRAARSNEQ